MYKNGLEQLGAVVEGCIHSSRLKYRLLSALPDLQAHLQGNSVILSFNEDFIVALTKACDFDDDPMHLVRAAQIVRKEMFEKKNLFDGFFKHSTEQEAVAPSLMALVRMILDGPSIKHPLHVHLEGCSFHISNPCVQQCEILSRRRFC